MSDAGALVAAYLLPAGEACWTWTEDGAGVTWTDGYLMALRDELEAAIGRLSEPGLPPFGALALLMAASQECWLDSGGGREHLVRFLGHVARNRAPATPAAAQRTIRIDMLGRSRGQSLGEQIQETVSDRSVSAARALEPYEREENPREQARKTLARPAIARDLLVGLDRVHALPARLRGSVDGKSLLAELVLEDCRDRLAPEGSAAVTRELASGVHPRHIDLLPPEHDGLQEFLRDVQALLPGLSGLTEERVAMRGRTGLDASPGPGGALMPPPEQVRGLLAGLLTDRELAGLAKLSLALMAAVHVPRSLSSSEELQLGGVSDLTNRGPMDRLLVSELAHDDLTLAVRIALNEALYLRREAPPRNPPQRRGILFDSGIRLWGVPRLFAAAVGLALGATSDPAGGLSVWRASGDRIHPVDLLTREGLTAHLEALEASPHPGAALACFVEELAHHGEPFDAILVTHAEVLADPEFLSALAALDTRGLCVAALDRDGSLALSSVSQRGLRPISNARLCLEDLVPAPAGMRGPQPLLAPEHDPALPLVLSVEPFPLLVPQQVRFAAVAVSSRHGLVSATDDGRLLHWTAPGRGPRQLTTQVPRGRLHAMRLDDDATLRVVAGRAPGNRVPMLTAQLATGRVASCLLQTGSPAVPLAACWQPGAVLLVFPPGRVDAFDLVTGDRMASLEKLPSHCKWIGGRFFHGSGGWRALAFDGHEVRLEPVPVEHPRTLALFDREGLDGPWGITTDGQVFSSVDGFVVPLPPLSGDPLRLLGVSADGHRLAIRACRTPRMVEELLVDLERHEVKRISGDPLQALEAPVHPAARAPNSEEIRNRFRAAGISDSGQLLLEPRRGAILTFGFSGPETGDLCLVKTAATAADRSRLLTFEAVALPCGVRFRMHAVQWPDGSRAFLDSRGMLHLKSSDRKLPELTVVLATGALAGWTSEGRCYGREYFCAEPAAAPARHLLAAIDRFVQVAR
ncbi:MAG: hypothetical protein HY303_04420 [Candidatus Wallbacteria bacterium]|nr:hypothetical protein [Candidatus Wallbacteria bacterium]